jgi:hypothetical protein
VIYGKETDAGDEWLAVRKFFILIAARDLHLVFPTPSATAVTIRDMHLASSSSGNDNGEGRHKMRVLGLAFGFAGALRVVSQFAVGILWVCVFPHSNTSVSCRNLGLVELICGVARTGTLLRGTPRWFRRVARRSASRAGVGTLSGLPLLSARGCLSARTLRSTILLGLSWLGELRSSVSTNCGVRRLSRNSS